MSAPDHKRRVSLRLRVMRLVVVGLIFGALVLLGYLAWTVFLRFGEPDSQAMISPAAQLTSPPPSLTLTPSLTPSPAPSNTPQPASTDIVVPTMVLKQDAIPLPPGNGWAALSIEEGGYAHLYAYSPGSGALVRLTSGEWDDVNPAINPDGRTVAFSSNRRGYWDLYLLDLPSGVITPLTETPEYEGAPDWSPDGQWLVYERYVGDESGGNLDIFIQPANGSESPIRLTDDLAADYSPGWSTRGRQVAFVSTRSGDAEIWLADLDRVEDRFLNVSRNSYSTEAHPVWSPDGTRLAWSSTSVDGFQAVQIWNVDQPFDRPLSMNSGDWLAWSPQGDELLAGFSTPNQTYLTLYAWRENGLALPVVRLAGAIKGMSWGRGELPPVASLPAGLAEAARMTPTPPWAPVVIPDSDVPGGRAQLIPLEGIEAPYGMLQDRVDESFYALKQRVAQETGWDFLSALEQAYIPLTSPLNPGLMEDWLYTGRAFAFNTSPVNAGWVLLGRENYGPETYWRIYLRTRFQDGSQGRPLKALPWNLNARHSGDPRAYEQGGAQEWGMPSGYWVDFTQLAAAYGWERLPALSYWQSSYSAARYNEFILRDGRDWLSAMLEVYPKAALDTPTPVLSPTPTSTPTATYTPTNTPTRTPYRSPTPTATFTRRPTNTPRPTRTPWPTITRTPTKTPRWTPTLPPSPTLPPPGSSAWQILSGLLAGATWAQGMLH